MRILVIGGTGFIGHHLVRELVAVGHEVVVLARSAAPSRQLPPNVTYHTGSMVESEPLASLLEQVDAVAHLASTTVPATGDGDPARDVQENLVGTLLLLELMTASRCKRLLFVSSGGTVYGSTNGVPVTEDRAISPMCSYGIVKASVELYLAHFARTRGLRPITIRAANPYGPSQGNLGLQGIVGTSIDRAYRGVPLEIWGSGAAVRDFIYIEDLVSLCRLAIESEVTGVFNGATGIGTSILQIVRLVEEISGRSLELVHLPARESDVFSSVLDSGKAIARFGWQPSTSLRDGIRHTWRWLQAARLEKTSLMRA